MTNPYSPTQAGANTDDVVAVEVTIDGMLVIADRLGISDFPVSMAIHPNIPQRELRDMVWDQVRKDLTDQEILDMYGNVHPSVAAMVDTLSRPDRTLECRWWRRKVNDGTMVRFVVCRKGNRHVVAARDGDLLVLQWVAPQVGLAGMVNTVLGTAEPAKVEPLTALSAKLNECRTPEQLAQFGIPAIAARTFCEIVADPTSWVEITANERHPGGTYSHTDVAAGVADSPLGRLVSIPRRVNGELFGSFLPGSAENLQRALDGLLEFLPSKSWFERDAADQR
ncbi:ESX secretion-associated protein EspG [Mycobacterium sp. M1]|uniref:ESX secretion-associated protein EspG n=1 Tax=Mycolicibacter acidiphilus TaxID=2835306 RepID=A0ABS5RIN0_9MYCO|nr:ESX secretion-associated protein EspG [Mycolicibacter acidiphilus]MBS9532804.1 ESX secretion-associated protein EspG [Mycolicibacter acidiphilus]